MSITQEEATELMDRAFEALRVFLPNNRGKELVVYLGREEYHILNHVTYYGMSGGVRYDARTGECLMFDAKAVRVDLDNYLAVGLAQ